MFRVSVGYRILTSELWPFLIQEHDSHRHRLNLHRVYGGGACRLRAGRRRCPVRAQDFSLRLAVAFLTLSKKSGMVSTQLQFATPMIDWPGWSVRAVPQGQGATRKLPLCSTALQRGPHPIPNPPQIHGSSASSSASARFLPRPNLSFRLIRQTCPLAGNHTPGLGGCLKDYGRGGGGLVCRS